jgi:hypothetical protein
MAAVSPAAETSVSPAASAVDEDLFLRLCDLAHDRGLHVAPDVALSSIFTISDGRSGEVLTDAVRALAVERVDFVLIDGAANPILALNDTGHRPWRSRAARRDRLKRRAFEKASLPLFDLGPVEEWAIDRDRIVRLLDTHPRLREAV